jgi:hypothetical protein
MESFRSSVGDAFITLPLLIVGFVFFLGTLTSNTGLLFLFLGHLLVVPALAFLANDKFNLTATNIVQRIISALIFFNVNASQTSWWAWIAAAIPLIGHGLTLNGPEKYSSFDFYNPLLFISKHSSKSPNPACSIYANTDPNDIYYSPSNWVTHITFFFGFILANVVAIYNEPAPPPPESPDPAVAAERKGAQDARVSNRKTTVAWIGTISVIVFVILLAFRYKKTDCEDKPLAVLIPIGLILMTGWSWFNVVKSCGVRPADTLGIVQHMLSSDLIDNPIVCAGNL